MMQRAGDMVLHVHDVGNKPPNHRAVPVRGQTGAARPKLGEGVCRSMGVGVRRCANGKRLEGGRTGRCVYACDRVAAAAAHAGTGRPWSP